MAQKKSFTYAQAKGAPAGFILPLLVIAQSIARMVYSVTTGTAVNHYLNSATGLVRIKAVTNGIFVAFSAGANKAPAKATGTLTSDATNVADGATVTVGTQVYRYKDTMAQAYDVQIGASAAISLDNLKAAVNASGTPGTEYFAGTEAHPDVIATTNTDTTQVVEAKLPGTAGNAIASTETSTHLAWGAATLASGADGNFDEYVPAGGTIDIALDEDVSVLSFIGDAGTASVSVVEY